MHTPKFTVPAPLPRAVLATLFLVPSFMLSCAPQDNPKYTDKGAALAIITEQLLIPLAEQSQGLAHGLQHASEAFCATPTDTAYTEAKVALEDMQLHWKSMEVMSFGPHRLFPWRTESRVDFWPARSENIIGNLQDAALELHTKNAAAKLGAAGTGLPVAEYLLHGPHSSLEDFKANPRRCDYLVAVSRDIVGEIGEYVRAWQYEFKNALLTPGSSDRYEDDSEAFGEVVNNVTFTVEVIREKKLGAPLGMKTGEPDPRLCEMRFAHRSIAAALASIEGVHALMTGCLATQDGNLDDCTLGLRALIAERNPRVARAYQGHYDAARRALNNIQGPLTEAISERPAQVTAAVDALRELVVYFHVEMTQALNVTVTFGGTDGD